MFLVFNLLDFQKKKGIIKIEIIWYCKILDRLAIIFESVQLRDSEERNERRCRKMEGENPMLIIHPHEVQCLRKEERPYFPSFSHQTCCVSLLSLSITISAGPLKWQEVRETSGEGRQTIKRGLYVEWREKEKSALSHTCPRRDWIYCSPPSFTGCFFDPGSV